MNKLRNWFLMCLLSGASAVTFAGACDNIPVWNSTVAYSKDNQVQFNNLKYQAKWWTQGENPAVKSGAWDVWINQGDCGATSSKSSSVTKSVVSSVRVCTTSQAPAWNSSNVYTQGMQAQYNGVVYEAKWWTQNNNPEANSGADGVWKKIIGTPCGSSSSVKSSVQPSSKSVTPSSRSSVSSVISGGKKVVGYFAEWGVYSRNYHVKNIETSGSANKLTHILYAFGNVTNGQCVIGDSYADYDKAYDAAGSVDGVADSWDAGTLRGSFGQLRKLKKLHPNLKVIWSFGGWTWSGGFPQAAANPTAFANSCYSLVEDPRWADVFDGIDIDWEYPNDCGLTCDTTSGFSGYKNLIQALRVRFGPNALVTSAIGAAAAKINAADYAGASQYLDFIMPMTYDFFGAFNAAGPTAPHSALYDYAGIPTPGFYSDAAVQLLKAKGVPSSKILLGVGFYGRGWTGVTQAAPGGSATGAAAGAVEPGINDYKVLKSTCPANGTVAGTAYAFCNGNWWSYDTPATLVGKMNYVNQQNLGGTFFWELSGDTPEGELINVLGNIR